MSNALGTSVHTASTATYHRETLTSVVCTVVGRVQNPSTGLCLDTMQREQEAAPLGLYPCHAALAATQYLSLALGGQLRDEERCAELRHAR